MLSCAVFMQPLLRCYRYTVLGALAKNGHRKHMTVSNLAEHQFKFLPFKANHISTCILETHLALEKDLVPVL